MIIHIRLSCRPNLWWRFCKLFCGLLRIYEFYHSIGKYFTYSKYCNDSFHFISFTGPRYQKITVTFDGHLFPPMNPNDVITAHCLQMACIYNFGTSFEIGKNGKALPKKFKFFFEFTSKYLWGIQNKYVSTGTGKTNAKRVSTEVQKLINKIENPELADWFSKKRTNTHNLCDTTSSGRCE